MINISATNRGSKRAEQDFYATPISVVEHFLNNYKLKEGAILEPSAGNGNIIRGIREKGYYDHITAVELRAEEKQHLKDYGTSEVYIENFLEYKPIHNMRTIISNPPYSIAREIIEHCFEIADNNTEIIMLLRTAFLESQKRFNFWQKHLPNGLYVLSQRPSFTGHGTDATSYAWFVWDGSNKQTIKVI